MGKVDIDRGVFTTSRILPGRPSAVFAAFEEPEVLARWWGPAGFANTFEIFEFREGGSWKFVMHGPDGSNFPNESTFLEVQAPAKVVIQHLSAPHFVLTVTLAERGSETEITWNQAFEDKDIAARIRHIVEPANEQNLDRLSAVLSEA
ncbi:MAG: hypothetical protein QOK37_3505 [Thermoanaerobaculia bacterium]|nr:hypothetical protein [Thermoanaerobaculia bacterium]